jgi:deazaflavin-dependent oxidoreductase (nitroreductase family)
MADTGKPPPKGIVKAFVGLHNFLYRLSGGRIMGRFGGKKAPVFLLTVKGRKSGKLITVPLLYVTTDRGYAVIASFGGAPSHPVWYLNLEAAGLAEVQVENRHIPVRVEIVDPDSARYAEIWAKAVAVYPDYDTYQTRTMRRIPVVELVPTG